MEEVTYDWNHPTGAELEIERKLRSDLPEPVVVRLEAVRSSIAQMRLECKALSIFEV